MKKFMFIIPLMAVSLLASCGSKSVDPSKIDLYKREIMYDETGEKIYSTTEREYNDKSLPKKETVTYQDYPHTEDIYEYTYDEHENEIVLHYTSYDSEEITEEGWMLNTYVYDEQSRVTRQATIMSFDYKTDWRVFESYEYDYQDNVTIERGYNGDGGLDYTTTYAYDEKGNLINEKIIYNTHVTNHESEDYEKVYTVDENNCTTKIESYEILSSGKRGNLTEVSEITYLNKLWYRPLKKTTAHYASGQIDSYMTYESEYDANNRIKLYKIYDGTKESTPPNYRYYATYEY